MRTMAQKRAAYALEETLAARNRANNDKFNDKFKSFTAGAPSMILQNGLGQTLAFWLAKSKTEHSEQSVLYDILSKWLKQTDAPHFGTCQQQHDFVRKLSEMDQRDYLRSQNEALALLEWVKRFANADLA